MLYCLKIVLLEPQKRLDSVSVLVLRLFFLKPIKFCETNLCDFSTVFPRINLTMNSGKMQKQMQSNSRNVKNPEKMNILSTQKSNSQQPC